MTSAFPDRWPLRAWGDERFVLLLREGMIEEGGESEWDGGYARPCRTRTTDRAFQPKTPSANRSSH